MQDLLEPAVEPERKERRSDGEAVKLPPKQVTPPARDDDERAPAREERFG